MQQPASSTQKIDQYEVVSRIDSGGMATVYKGFQPSLNRAVAIKVLHRKFARDPQFVKRFHRESLIIARLSHPNIIHVIDRGITPEGQPYFVMDYIKGTNIARVIRQSAYTTNQKLDVIVQVCKALSYAHKNGVIHRDIKPANILIDQEGNALVADFGIAHLFDKSAQPGLEVTRDNLIMGTLAYMSPEQKQGISAITQASDIYSLGVVMYELLTGAKPKEDRPDPSLVDPTVPDQMDGLIRQCLAAEMDRRPASVDVIREQILEILQGAHIRTAKRQQAVQGVQKMEDIFTLLDIIRETEYATVYLVRHKIQSRLMVVKRYSLPMGGLKSATILKDLNHPHIVDVFGVSGHRTNYIIVMEYVGGGSLADRMLVPHTWQAALSIATQICRGLKFAHDNRILHGNLRPSNILFTDTGTVKITDFGLNEHYALDPDRANWFNTCNQPKSIQADIFAVGAVFYKLITGQVPSLKGKSIVPHSSFFSLPKGVQKLVARLLSQNPGLRFRNMAQVLDAIDNIQPESGKEMEETVVLDVATIAATDQAAPVPAPETAKPAKSGWRVLFLFVLLLAAVLTYFLVAYNRSDGTDAALKWVFSRIDQWVR